MAENKAGPLPEISLSKGIGQNIKTKVIPVNATQIGRIITPRHTESALDDWDIEWDIDSSDLRLLQDAASQARQSDIPLAFPTETVYGLGADASRSEAVRGIFAAKNRPVDNPLIVHFHSLNQLRKYLPRQENDATDPIPAIYKPLIEKFWPGPLTILLPTRDDGSLAPEVTAGLTTFGARMPRSFLALALLKLADVPMAAPSANASTKPSPTTAEHVLEDLDGRIQTILDGGPCDVGVESTVVDGLSSPPAILRPGGVTIEQLRRCEGWEDVVIGYKDEAAGMNGVAPRAPGMKYRHYSPKAPVLLYEAGTPQPSQKELLIGPTKGTRLGIIKSILWESYQNASKIKSTIPIGKQDIKGSSEVLFSPNSSNSSSQNIRNLLNALPSQDTLTFIEFPLSSDPSIKILEVDIGQTAESIARGLFSALRLLDRNGVDRILLEGIDDSSGGELAAAIMNRIRKAAEVAVR